MPVMLGKLTAYTLQELGEKFNTTTVTLRAYIRDGKLRANKVGGRWYVTERAVAEFLETAQEPGAVELVHDEEDEGAKVPAGSR